MDTIRGGGYSSAEVGKTKKIGKTVGRTIFQKNKKRNKKKLKKNIWLKKKKSAKSLQKKMPTSALLYCG